MDESKRISFKFHPRDWENRNHAVEKSEGGMKRRYLEGISSGVQKDAHGENMTESCVKSFHDQANSGDILLYEGQHGVNFVDDIGILTHSEILPNGDWFTEYRLYDEMDGFAPHSVTLEKADKLWKQVNGITPYKVPKQKGFSIEGEVPDGGIISVDGTGRRVMNNVHLDGVVIVPRPAYTTSVAGAVYKALGIMPPDVVDKVHKDLRSRLHEKVREAEVQDNFYQKKFIIENELENAICDIFTNERHNTSEEKLEILFQEYSDLMIGLILQNEGLFKSENVVTTGDEAYQNSGRLRQLQQLQAALENLAQISGGS